MNINPGLMSEIKTVDVNCRRIDVIRIVDTNKADGTLENRGRFERRRNSLKGPSLTYRRVDTAGASVKVIIPRSRATLAIMDIKTPVSSAVAVRNTSEHMVIVRVKKELTNIDLESLFPPLLSHRNHRIPREVTLSTIPKRSDTVVQMPNLFQTPW